MLTLLSPAALWALAALALPLALHLWRRPPRTVRLGSLRFLRGHPGRRVRDLRWREWWLLLVRLALLAILAVLLARPLWQRPPPRTPQRWVLLDPAAVPTGAALERLRTLQAGGAATHLLSAGLPTVAGPGNGPNAGPTDLWSLLREADATLPAGSTLAIFSPARLASLRGVRPALRAKVEWVETAAAATSTPRPGANRTPGSIVPLSVLVLHAPDRAEDARYLAAAVRAAVDESERRLDLRVIPITPDLSTSANTDWTCWLSAAAPPAALEQRRTQWLRDAADATQPAAGWIVPQPDTPGATALTPGVRLWRRGPAGSGATIWTDEHGTPLLTRTPTPHGMRWEFASRFHPAFTDLPRTTAFPAFVRALLLAAGSKGIEDDTRLAAASQARPSDGTPPPATVAATPETTDLHWLCWTAAGVLFVTERLLSHRR